ncbi:hypothetical protein CHS0354_021755 [Potamilus streckersoni]|uniref:Cysteine and tyrosine-rich protein 1 n=1 Tax=Potamilus streckersoni TaxID=2493646 RepID=A0AAE0TKC1_9BIVA|nr:hypothetical protein CHS0354_021755 [Potamilus streckersoni]
MRCVGGFLCNPVTAGSYCFKTISASGISYTTYQYCDYGCCYEYTSSPCCYINVGLIVGAVIGSLIGVALLISGICIIIHCSKAHTRKSTVVVPQAVTTNTQYVQPMQPMGYQPYYQATVTSYHTSSAQPMPPPPYNAYYPPPAEPLPPPIYVEGTRPPADHRNK